LVVLFKVVVSYLRETHMQEREWRGTFIWEQPLEAPQPEAWGVDGVDVEKARNPARYL